METQNPGNHSAKRYQGKEDTQNTTAGVDPDQEIMLISADTTPKNLLKRCKSATNSKEAPVETRGNTETEKAVTNEKAEDTQNTTAGVDP